MDIYKRLIARLKEKQDDLDKRLDETQDVKEIKEIGKTLKALAEEIAEAEAQLKAMNEEPKPTEEPKEPTTEPVKDRAEGMDEEEEPEEDPENEDVTRSKNWVKVASYRGGAQKVNARKADMKELEARGKALKEERAVTVSASDILLPKHTSDQITPNSFRQVSTFFDLTKKRNLQGGESYEVPFTKEYGMGGVTAEGGDYTEAETTFGKAKINKVKITAYAELSEELEKLPSADYATEVQKGVEIALKKKIAREQILGTGASNSFIGITSTHADNSAVASTDDLVISGIDQDTLNKIIFAYGGDEEVEQKGVLLLNKEDLLAFSLVRNDIGDHAYKIDLANQTINTVPYIINSNLPALTNKDTTENTYSMIYGIPQYYETAIFSPVEMKKSYDFKFKQGMVAIKASVFTGGNTVSYRGFMRVKKGNPSA